MADATARAEESAALLNKTVLTIPHQAGDDGRLFGSVTSQDIVDAIKEARGIAIDRRKVHLEEPIRTVGTRMVVVEVDEGVTATVKTMVVEQKSSRRRRAPQQSPAPQPACRRAGQRFGCQKASSPPLGVATTLRQPAGPSRASSRTEAPSAVARRVASWISGTST